MQSQTGDICPRRGPSEIMGHDQAFEVITGSPGHVRYDLAVLVILTPGHTPPWHACTAQSLI
jgi:hypothetical protein